MKIIKTEKDYDSALERIEELVDIDPEVNTEEADELELLVLLVNKYEEKKFQKDNLSDNLLEELRKLSMFETGPVLASKLLQKTGIKLVIVPNLKGMHIDGASFLTDDGQAIIILSLRYDRTANFWFTLFHELGHMKKHIFNKEDIFFDDLKSTINLSEIEKEADSFAEDYLISKEKWLNFYNEFLTKEDILSFANAIRISPAIVIGRVQKYRDDYKFLRQYIGQNTVRKQFDITNV